MVPIWLSLQEWCLQHHLNIYFKTLCRSDVCYEWVPSCNVCLFFILFTDTSWPFSCWLVTSSLKDIGPFSFLDLPMQGWDNKASWQVHAATSPPVAPVNSPHPKLSWFQHSNYDDAGSAAVVGPQDTHSVAGRILFPAPQGYVEAVGEVHPPPYSQCLHHFMFRSLLFPSGQFQTQALWPGLGGCAHPSYWLSQRREALFRASGHTWTRWARWE